MILSKHGIVDRGLIVNPSANGFGRETSTLRPVGYNLTVGDVYIPRQTDGTIGSFLQAAQSSIGLTTPERSEEIVIPPQGIFVVISQEKVKMPEDVCGYALPKTRLSEEGILILNTGIIDPLYEGFVSGTLINFRKTNYIIKRGMPFLRLIFEQVCDETLSEKCALPPSSSQPTIDVRQKVSKRNKLAAFFEWAANKLVPDIPPSSDQAASSLDSEAIRLSDVDIVNRENYTKDKIFKAQEYPGTFLNVPQTVKTVSAEVLKSERELLIRIATYGAVLFAILTTVSVFAPKYVVSEEKVSNGGTQ